VVRACGPDAPLGSDSAASTARCPSPQRDGDAEAEAAEAARRHGRPLPATSSTVSADTRTTRRRADCDTYRQSSTGLTATYDALPHTHRPHAASSPDNKHLSHYCLLRPVAGNEMGGVFFCKKVENGRCKKWTFPQRRVHYVQYQYFYFTFYLFRGCVRTQRTPCPRVCYCYTWLLQRPGGHRASLYNGDRYMPPTHLRALIAQLQRTGHTLFYRNLNVHYTACKVI